MGILPALMRIRDNRRILAALATPILLAAGLPALAQSPEAAPPAKGGWGGEANLNLAGSYGNAGSGSLGLSAEASRATDLLRVAVEGGLLRASTDTVTRHAIGSPDAFEVERRVMSHTSADRSHLRARITEPSSDNGNSGLAFFAAAGWERDAPAGVRSRYDLTVGVGTTWGDARNGGRRPFEIGAGLSAVHQSDEVTDPEVGAASLGLRLDARAETRYRGADLALVSASTWNLRNTGDLRFDVTGSVAFPLSSRLAFRTSVQTLYDSHPSLERVSLFGTRGGSRTGTVAVRRRRTDLIVLASLVIGF
ncbi:MAG: DUF481 domain-containing protein [Acidobacteria bacterium]|nr:DUF481 domain-containing protein [Acidobacteriota bacterium]